MKQTKKIEVPVWEKINLTLEEASALFGIGVNELRKRTDENGCPFVLFKGSHRLIKRKKFEEYLNKISVW